MQAKYWNRLPLVVTPVSVQRAFKGLLDLCIYPTFLRPLAAEKWVWIHKVRHKRSQLVVAGVLVIPQWTVYR